MMNKKGFTLIELLAVIVILAALAIILTPTITNIIKSTDENSARVSAQNYADAVQNYISSQITIGKDVANGTYTIADLTGVEVVGNKPKSGTITIKDSQVDSYDFIAGNYHVTKKSGTDTVEVEPASSVATTYTDKALNGADPVLDSSMIAVTIDDTGIVKKADLNSEWYNYTNKRWANAIIVSSDKLSTYNDAKAESIISPSDIKAYLVWIPRYSYKLFNVAGATGTTASTIEITFENKNTTKKTGTANGEYLTHPGFTFGTTELNGFWVGKFEMTGTVDAPTVLSNAVSLRTQRVNKLFETILKFGTDNNVKEDTHMIMNKEWGAIAYLTNSVYGINTEVRLNNSTTYKTGCGELTADAASTASCDNAYGTVTDYPQSTTGNITGVFDMSGGAFEYVMGVLVNADNVLYSGYSTYTNSDFNGLLYNGTTYTGGSAFPDSKYYQTYKTTGYLGDALEETQNWNNDYYKLLNTSGPWYMRGGNCSEAKNAGIFNSYYAKGNGIATTSTRLVICSN